MSRAAAAADRGNGVAPMTPPPSIRIVSGDAARHASACAAILDAWLNEHDWARRPDDPDEAQRFADEHLFDAKLLLVALRENEPVGFASLSCDDMLTAMFVRPEWRGHGLGHALMGRVKRAASWDVVLAVDVPNVSARLFYEWHGFVEVGHDRDESDRAMIVMRWQPPPLELTLDAPVTIMPSGGGRPS